MPGFRGTIEIARATAASRIGNVVHGCADYEKEAPLRTLPAHTAVSDAGLHGKDVPHDLAQCLTAGTCCNDRLFEAFITQIVLNVLQHDDILCTMSNHDIGWQHLILILWSFFGMPSTTD